jgi:hypothetical protein
MAVGAGMALSGLLVGGRKDKAAGKGWDKEGDKAGEKAGENSAPAGVNHPGCCLR